MVTQTKKSTAPNGAKLEAVILIDRDKWDDLKAQGFDDKAIQEAIEKSITFSKSTAGIIATPPILDIDTVTLQKYY